MKLSASLRLIFSLSVVLVTACQGSPSTGVRLDLSPLIQQSLESVNRVDHIDLSVEAQDSTYRFNQTFPADETDIEIQIPANTPLSLIVQAKARVDDTPVTSYFGATKFVASPGTVSDVDLKVRPTGGVAVSFTFPRRLLTASARPDADTSGVRFRSTGTVPMIPDAHNERLVRWQSNQLILSQTLHAGTYELSGVLVIDRVAYILPGTQPLVITHGGVLSLDDIVISCEDPNADEDQDGHPCRDDCDDSEKRCWLPHHCLDSDGDDEINCLDAVFFNTGAPIPPTCGDGVPDAGERCDGDCPQSAADCPADTGCTFFTFSGHAANCSAHCEQAPVPCGQGQSCDESQGGCVCDPDHEAAGDICVHEKQVSCTDDAPEHARANVVPVTITYFTDGGWTSPAACLWECDADYLREEQRCINTRQASCKDAAPGNATSTPGMVTVTYANGGWSTPEACAWTCDTASDCVIGGACISKGAADPTNSCRSCKVAVNATGYSPAVGQACGGAACTRSQCNPSGECEEQGPVTCAQGQTCDESQGGCVCAPDHEAAGAICIHEKQVNCTDDAPEHASANVLPVTITYSTDGGWTSPAACLWECEADYVRENQRCINTRKVNCKDVAPENATSSLRKVTVTYANGRWSLPEACAWACDSRSDCVISGVCISKGAADPTNSCLSCQAAVNATGYSPAVGRACGDAACTRSQCNSSGVCEEAEPVTCASGLTCSEEAGGCACAPNTRQCTNDDTGAPTFLTVCEASGSEAHATACDYHCLTLSDTTALCLEDRKVTGLSATTNGTTLVLRWEALVPQTESFKYELQTRNAARAWETVATTSTPTYTLAQVARGTYLYRVRGVEAGYPMTFSNVASANVNPSPGLSVSVGSPDFLYLFATENAHKGDLGGREEADNLCSSGLPFQDGALTCVRKIALLSMSDSDSIANLPDTNNLSRELPIKGLNGTTLADNWPDLVDGSIQFSLLEASIDARTWWSGSDRHGNNQDNCAGWTSRSDDVTGRYGGASATDQDWINKGSSGCDEDRHVLCLCVPPSWAD